MLTFALACKILWSAEYLLGPMNIQAHCLSQESPQTSNWQIMLRRGPCSLDLFVSRINTQLPRYISWRLVTQSTAVDTFLRAWDKEKAYTFPPFCLISHYLAKVWKEHAQLFNDADMAHTAMACLIIEHNNSAINTPSTIPAAFASTGKKNSTAVRDWAAF